jgi:hypothetical protein
LNRLFIIILAILTLIFPQLAKAGESTWKMNWDVSLYGYPEFNDINTTSLLNPDNEVARLAETIFSAEARANLELKNDQLFFYLRPIFLLREAESDSLPGDEQQVYLSQWQARLAPGHGFTASVGRDLLTWGPGQFRSPSNPFYFSNGRSDPIRELSGLDDLKVTWSPGPSSSVLLARITGSGYRPEGGNPWKDSWLGKGEWRGDEWTAGLILADITDQQPFAGIYYQWTSDDGWLLYGEAGSGTIGPLLNVDSAGEWQVQAESSRATNVLVGASYTLLNGQSIIAEYLWYGHGYDSSETRAYFDRAEAAALLPENEMIQTLGSTIITSPQLLNHNYLHLIWQNSLLAADTYWRLMYSHNFDDNSGQFALYADHYLAGGLSCFLLAVTNTGGNRQEFGQFIDNSLQFGVRLALP